MLQRDWKFVDKFFFFFFLLLTPKLLSITKNFYKMFAKTVSVASKPIRGAFCRFYHPAALSARETPVSQQVSESLGLPVKACDLLTHALENHVPTVGFSEPAVFNTLKEHGYSTAAKSVFPDSGRGGELDLVLVHLARSRVATAQYAEELIESGKSKIPVRDLFLSRLRLNEPIARHLDQAQAILTQPGNVPMSLAELHRLSDDLCFYSGDRSHSFDWYAKRMAISSLYVASELFMSQDKSLGFKDTFEFVDRRLDELENTKYVVNSVTEWSSFFLRSSANVAASFWSRG